MSVPLNQIRQGEEASRAEGPAPAAGSAATQRLPVIVQFVKFGIVGVSNTLLAFAIYTLLVKVFGVWYVAASGIGFAIGAVNGFLLNRKWTFKEHTGDALTPVRWAIVQSCGLGCNLGLVYLFVGGAGLDELVGQAFATAIVTVLTFAANRSWTFRVRPHAAPAAADGPSTIAAADGPSTIAAADGPSTIAAADGRSTIAAPDGRSSETG